MFRYRQGRTLSATTEKPSEFHATQVMQRLQQDFELLLENFCITLSNYKIPPCYLVNIELATGAVLREPQAFIRQFDRYLREIQPSYAVKRPDQIPAPRLRILASGSFDTLQQRVLQAKNTESQFKFPHISEDRQLLAGLLIAQEVLMPE